MADLKSFSRFLRFCHKLQVRGLEIFYALLGGLRRLKSVSTASLFDGFWGFLGFLMILHVDGLPEFYGRA